MAARPDLSLPETVPEMERYNDAPMSDGPFALYTLCEMDDDKLERYRQVCDTNNDDGHGEGQVRLPTRARFSGCSLRDIVKYHLELGTEGDFDPTFFIVCVYSDSGTVLIVTLNDDDLECKPDLLWTKMEESGLLLVNLQISNTDWYEAKEDSLEAPGAPNDDGDDAPPGSDTHEKGDDGQGQDGEDYGATPPTGFHIQVYNLPGTDEDRLVDDLEPSSYAKKKDRSDWVCKPCQLPTDASRDPVRFATNLHLFQCSQHPTLQKNYFIVADEPKFTEEGVALVNIDWDGQIAGKTKTQLLELGRSLEPRTQRAEALDTSQRAAVFNICLYAHGDKSWEPKVKQFAIYNPNTSDAEINLATAIDQRWVKRGHGQERVALGGSMQPKEIEDLWPALIRRHVAYCKRQKFVPGFVRQYFIYCGTEKPTPETAVQLIKLEWNGDLRQAAMLADDYYNKASATEVKASHAHKKLTDTVDERIEWQGEKLQ